MSSDRTRDDHHHYIDDDLVNVETHHEKSDVNVRALLWAVALFVVFGIVSHFALWGLYEAFVHMQGTAKKNPPLTAMVRPETMSVPQNQPLLQPFPRKDARGVVVPPFTSTPVSDLAEMRAMEEQALHTYGWIDREKGVVRIPIDDAKQLAVQRGFAVQAPTPMSDTRTTAGTANAPASPPAMPQEGEANAARVQPPRSGRAPQPPSQGAHQ